MVIYTRGLADIHSDGDEARPSGARGGALHVALTVESSAEINGVAVFESSRAI